MKKVLAIFAIVCTTPLFAFATPSSVDRITDHIEPLIKTDYIKGDHFLATSTTATSTLPSLSGTGASFNYFCLSLDCRSAWPTGTMTSVSINTANGFAGSSSGGATPALTLTTTVTGVLKGNGTAISTASNGTDFSLITAKTCGGNDFVSAVTAGGVFTCTTPASSGATGNVATSTSELPNQVAVFSTNQATPAKIAGSNSFVFDGTNVGIGTSTPGHILDIIGDEIRQSNVATDATNKAFRFVDRNFTNAQNDFLLLFGQSKTTGNTLLIGGGQTGFTAASAISIFAGTGNNTDTGTNEFSVTTAGVSISTLGTGIVKSIAGALSNATNGIDYTLLTANTCGGGQFFNSATAAGVLGCGTPPGGSGIGTVATSSQETAGQVAVFSTTAGYPALLYSAPTSTPTVTSPITYSGTLGSFVGGVAGAFACATCNTSNATVSSITGGLGLNGGVITTSGTLSLKSYTATSTPDTSGQILAFTSTSATPATYGGDADLTFTNGNLTTFTNGSTTKTTIGTLWVTGSTNGLASLDANGLVSASSSVGANYVKAAGADTQVQFNDGGAFAGNSGLVFAKTGTKLTATNASTTNLSAATSLYGSFASAVWLADANKLATAATTQTCTNQFFRSLSAAYAVTCAAVSLTADVTGILPIANGGTATSTGGVTNGVIYYDGTRHTNSSLFQFNGTNLSVGATTTFGTLLNLNGVANLGTATSTFYGTGINLASGCFAVNNVCVGGSGGSVSSVADSGTGTLTISPTTGAVVAAINLANSNTWTNFISITSTAGWYRLDGSTLAYASSTNQSTIFGSNAGGNVSTTSATNVHESAVGFGALQIQSTGDGNTAFGTEALMQASSTPGNTAVGFWALRGSVATPGLTFGGTVGANTAVGYWALSSSTSGVQNTAVGYQSLRKLTTASSNAFLGDGSGKTISTGGSNTGVGHSALQSVQSGSSNTAIGSSAGQTVTGAGNINIGATNNGGSGSDNVQIGFNDTDSTSGSGNIVIGAQSTGLPNAAGSQQLNIGNVLYGTGVYNTGVQSGQPTANGTIGVGTTTPWGKLSLSLNTNDTTMFNAFTIASSTATATTTLFRIDNVGHIYASSTSPVLSGCGTAPSMKGSDTWGEITIGSTASGCTLTFGIAWSVAPVCVISNQSMSVVNAMTYTISTTALTLTMTSSGGDKIDYICHGSSL